MEVCTVATEGFDIDNVGILLRMEVVDDALISLSGFQTPGTTRCFFFRAEG